MKAPNMEKEKQKLDLGLLEEDDDFEEFPAENWNAGNEEEEANPWEDNWDDDIPEEDFSVQLKAEIEKMKHTKCLQKME